MRLRPRQRLFVERSLAALCDHGNTLSIASTGFGKTIALSAVVAKINAQRSVEIRLLGKDGWVSAGNVTIPPNQDIPRVGWVVEVRYLYAFPESGIVYQPVYLGKRPDVEPTECLVAQLKFKPSDAEDA